MTLRQFYDWQTEGGAQDVSRLVAALEEREIHWCMIGGLAVNHWALEPMDTLRGKVAAYEEPQRRPSKRQKDLSDISRLLEAHPEIKDLIPAPIYDKLEK